MTSQEAGVTGRVKDPASFQAKAARVGLDGVSPRYLRPLSAIHDQVALRVVVLHAGFLSHARDLIQAVPELIVEEHEDKSIAHASNRSFGYRGVHLLIRPVDVDVPRPASMTLPELLELRFPGAKQPTTPALRWIGHCAQALGLSDVAALDQAVAGAPLERIEAIFQAVGHSPRSQVRQLDDALLWIGRERYVDAAEAGVEGTSDRYANGRPGILRWRLERLSEAGVLDA